jgi:septal ring factor EnvC (AmiA/AmiB activator)
LKRFFLGKKAKDLEETIAVLENNISNLKKSRDEIQKDLAAVNTKLKKSIRGLETIRFNPFPDQGSNQSFAIGMLNEDGDGVVFSSLYSRERMSVFAKPIKNGKSEYELSEEEKEVLKKAEVL